MEAVEMVEAAAAGLGAALEAVMVVETGVVVRVAVVKVEVVRVAVVKVEVVTAEEVKVVAVMAEVARRRR